MQGLSALQTLASASKADASNTRGAASVLEGAWDERPPPAPLLQTRLGRLPSMARPSHVQIQPQAVICKQLTDPRLSLSDRVSSSGSRSGQESTSLSLATMVYGLMDDDFELGKCGRARCNCSEGSFDDNECFSGVTDDQISHATEIRADVLQDLVSNMSAAEQKLLETIGLIVMTPKQTADLLCIGDEINRSNGGFKCYVVQKLHRLGYNAGLCKSKWDPVERQPGGEYEYIDVIMEYSSKNEVRLIIDLEFRGHFEIARPTREYRKMLKLLPSVFVGSSEKLQQIINTMCEAAKISLKERGLHLPPWRKSSYILAKWFSTYVRIPVESARLHNRSISIPGTERESGRTEATPPKQDIKKTEKEPYGKRQEGKLARLESIRRFRSANNIMEGSHKLTVSSTEWKPPFVEPRILQRSGRLVGLAAALRQSEAALREQKTEQKHSTSGMNLLKQVCTLHHTNSSLNLPFPKIELNNQFNRFQ
ncbi:hypothetical protein O6H91_Y512200 [Diphasiastrum complanatum]|nr:hypothetical protein O6H91_Y512200 [Diphasiastrum complanatum]